VCILASIDYSACTCSFICNFNQRTRDDLNARLESSATQLLWMNAYSSCQP